MNKINFKQPKYIIPTIAYVGLMLVGWLFIDLFSTEIKDDKPNNLQTTEYLNSDLPEANVSKDIGSKRKNVRDVFGDIRDRSAVQDFVEDADTVNRKEEFESKYSDEELKLLEQQKHQQEEIKRLQEMNEQLRQSAKKGASLSSEDFSLPISEADRQRALDMRRKGLLEELDRDLNNVRRRGEEEISAVADAQDSIADAVAASKDAEKGKAKAKAAVTAVSDDVESSVVVKKVKDDSEYFNTLSHNEESNNLIKAIIDEEIKAVDGSRVRLRLLDDIEINNTVIKKGTYLFATMSGFGQQRVKGKVSSILVGDEIMKINLSLYDTTDGLEGLYVPASSFRETAKDIGSSAMQTNMNMNMGYGGESVMQWAGQAIQNAYQRASNAISKAIKKNKVRLKYGTHVYLVNGKAEKKRK